jgi:hypothetical protein
MGLTLEEINAQRFNSLPSSEQVKYKTLGLSLNPFTLPSVALDDKTELPEKPRLYFVLDDDRLLYIGKSKNMKQRWAGHHRHDQVKQMSRYPRIAFLDIDDVALLYVERMIITRFKPILNDTRVPRASSGVFTSEEKENLNSSRTKEKSAKEQAEDFTRQGKTKYKPENKPQGFTSTKKKTTPDELISSLADAALQEFVDAAKPELVEILQRNIKGAIAVSLDQFFSRYQADD